MRVLIVLCLVSLLSLSVVQAEITAPNLTYSIDGLNATVSWSVIPEASGYKLNYAPYPFAGESTIGTIDVGSQVSFSAQLWDGAAYYVAVQSYSETEISFYSNIGLLFIGSPDTDSDGFTTAQGDCNDLNPAVNPSITEICGDGVDQNCSGGDEICSADPRDIDNDQDGLTENQGDCDDSDPTISASASDIPGDGIDQDCDGQDKIITYISPGLQQCIDAAGGSYQISSLICNGIDSLRGIENLTNLRYFQSNGSSKGKISDITPLESLTNLTNLSLFNNNIFNISPLSNLINLEELTLSINNIYDISALSSLYNLGYLYINDNNIINIQPLSNLTNLRLLVMSNNLVSDLSPLNGLTKLKDLVATGNPAWN